MPTAPFWFNGLPVWNERLPKWLVSLTSLCCLCFSLYFHLSALICVPFLLNFRAWFLSLVTAFLSCMSWSCMTLSESSRGDLFNSTPTFTGLILTSTGCLGSRRKETLASNRQYFCSWVGAWVILWTTLICMKCLNKGVIWRAWSHTLGPIATCFY